MRFCSIRERSLVRRASAWGRRLGIVFLAAVGVAAAEDEPVPHVLRLLPLGDHPPFRQELRNGVRYELDPPEGSVPPPKVELADPGGEKALPFRLRLGTPSTARRLKVGEVREVGIIDSDGQSWAKVPLAESGETLAVAWRSRDGDWSKPRFLPLRDGPLAVPRDAVRLLNVAPYRVGVQWGSSKVVLDPGKPLVLEFPEGGRGAELRVLHAMPDGKLRQVYSNLIERNPSMSHQFFVYATDDEGARTPFRVIPLIEARVRMARAEQQDQESGG